MNYTILNKFLIVGISGAYIIITSKNYSIWNMLFYIIFMTGAMINTQNELQDVTKK